jgi:hypothetical protein
MYSSMLILGESSHSAHVLERGVQLGLAVHRTEELLSPNENSEDAVVRLGREKHAFVWSASPQQYPLLTRVAERLKRPHFPWRTNIHWTQEAHDALRDQVDFLETKTVCTWEDVERTLQEWGVPLWIRGVTDTGSDTCIRIRDEGDLTFARQKWFAACATRPEGLPLLVQRAMEGGVYRLYGFKVGRDFHPVEVVEETVSDGPFRLPLRHVVPCGLEALPYTYILDLSRTILRSLPLGFTAAEIEFVLTDAKKPLVADVLIAPNIEKTAADLLAYALGLDMAGDLLRVLQGEPPVATPNSDLGAAVGWFTPKPGVLKAVSGVEEARTLPGVQDVVVPAMNSQDGAPVLRHITDLETRDRMGYIIAVGATREHALEHLEAALARVTFSVEAMVEA